MINPHEIVVLHLGSYTVPEKVSPKAPFFLIFL